MLYVFILNIDYPLFVDNHYGFFFRIHRFEEIQQRCIRKKYLRKKLESNSIEIDSAVVFIHERVVISIRNYTKKDEGKDKAVDYGV